MTRAVLKAALLLLLCVCCLCACHRRAEFSGGQQISGEEIQEMLGTSVGESEPGEKLYYFVSGGGLVYHSSSSCSYLKNSKNVLSGTMAQVSAAGKERLCSACAKNEEDTPLFAEADAARTCYYTAGGSVWHYDSACASLVHSENVRSGTVEQAMLDGKTRACARCGDQ